MKKITAIILILIICLSMASCSGESGTAPDGMHKASLDNEPFELYVPKSWTVNTASGISGAYYSPIDKITVSARYHALEDPEQSLEDYVSFCILSYANTLDSYETVKNESTLFAEKDSASLRFTFLDGEVEFTGLQLITLIKGNAILLTFFCPTEQYDANAEQFDEIKKEFVITKFEEDKGDYVTDKKTPDGMKIASGKKLEYRLYVPTSWICHSESGMSEAYYPESGRPNVTVTSYSPDEDMTAEEYFEICEEEYKKNLSEYTFIGSEERKIDECDAISFIYTASYDGVTYKLMQTVFARQGLVYSFTYTATESGFDSHLEDVETMMDAFIFR